MNTVIKLDYEAINDAARQERAQVVKQMALETQRSITQFFSTSVSARRATMHAKGTVCQA